MGEAGRRQVQRAIIGWVLIVVMAALAIVIFNLSAIVRTSGETYSIVGIFHEAPRLQVGSPVRLAGVAVGQVTRIELLTPEGGAEGPVGEVMVRGGEATAGGGEATAGGGEVMTPLAATLQLPRRLLPELRRDSGIRLQRQRLLGEPVVELTPGTPDSPALRPGDTLYATPLIRLETLFALTGAVRASIDTLIKAGAELGEQSKPALAALTRVQAELLEVRAEFLELDRALATGPLTAFIREPTGIEALNRAAAVVDEIVELARARAQAMSGADALPALELLLERAGALRAEIERLQLLLREPSGFPGRWREDPAIRDAIDRARAHLDSLIELTRRKPWRYFF